MAINDFCAQVNERHYHWKLVRDFVDGEHTIKDEGEYYLPRKGGQSDLDYLAYKARAKPGDYTGQTLESMHGSVMRRAPSIENLKEQSSTRFLKILTTKDIPYTSMLPMFSETTCRQTLAVSLATFLKLREKSLLQKERPEKSILSASIILQNQSLNGDTSSMIPTRNFLGLSLRRLLRK